MRRTIAISLMMLFSWTLITPFLAPGIGAHLPACCRKMGKHHCTMGMTGQLSGSQRGIAAVSEKCPCCPASARVTHPPTYKHEAVGAFYAADTFHTAPASQTQARCNTLSPRSHPKRGPPAPLAYKSS
ncbi:MAG: hypothetical protein ABSE51_14740 [Terracidiphilus sp.]